MYNYLHQFKPSPFAADTVGQTLAWLAVIAYCVSILYAIHRGYKDDHDRNPNHHGTRKD